MSGVVDKYSGITVGHTFDDTHGSDGLDYEAATAGASVEEFLDVAPDIVLVPQIDLATGKFLWLPASCSAAARNAVAAKSQMTSMLKDTARCQMYETAIDRCIQGYIQEIGRNPRVLDVGAGTGLLSMYSHRSGAKAVTGIEQWGTMANIAKEVTAANGMQPIVENGQFLSGVRILNSHSRNLSLRQENENELTGELSERCIDKPVDVVVSEIVDSVLLGEGILPALHDAYSRFLAPASQGTDKSVHAIGAPMCVPSSAKIYAQLVYSPLAEKWQRTDAIDLNASSEDHDNDAPPLYYARKDWSDTCRFTGVPIPVHARALTKESTTNSATKNTTNGPAESDFQPVSLPFVAFDLSFLPKDILSSPSSTPSAEPSTVPGAGPVSSVYRVPLHPSIQGENASIRANSVLIWWDMTLWQGKDANNSIVYGTAPDTVEKQGWQDHWVQCLYPLPEDVSVAEFPDAEEGTEVTTALQRFLEKNPTTDTSEKDQLTTVANEVISFVDGYYSLPRASSTAEPFHAWEVSPAKDNEAKNIGFTVASLRTNMNIRFVVAPGTASVWPTKRDYNVTKRRWNTELLDSALPAPTTNRVRRILESTPLIQELELCVCGLHGPTAVANLDRRWMLHDKARNTRYRQAINSVLNMIKRERAEEVLLRTNTDAYASNGIDTANATSSILTESGPLDLHVLDVGTGSICALMACTSSEISDVQCIKNAKTGDWIVQETEGETPSVSKEADEDLSQLSNAELQAYLAALESGEAVPAPSASSGAGAGKDLSTCSLPVRVAGFAIAQSEVMQTHLVTIADQTGIRHGSGPWIEEEAGEVEESEDEMQEQEVEGTAPHGDEISTARLILLTQEASSLTGPRLSHALFHKEEDEDEDGNWDWEGHNPDNEEAMDTDQEDVLEEGHEKADYDAEIEEVAGDDEEEHYENAPNSDILTLQNPLSSLPDDIEGIDFNEIDKVEYVYPSEKTIQQLMQAQNNASASTDYPPTQIDLLAAEPYFEQSQHAPLWSALAYWYQRAALQANGVLHPRCRILPVAFHVMLQPVVFEHLADSHTAVGTVQGLDHAALDKIQIPHIGETILHYPLYQYNYKELAEPQAVVTGDYTRVPPFPGIPWVHGSSTVAPWILEELEDAPEKSDESGNEENEASGEGTDEDSDMDMNIDTPAQGAQPTSQLLASMFDASNTKNKSNHANVIVSERHAHSRIPPVEELVDGEERMGITASRFGGIVDFPITFSAKENTNLPNAILVWVQFQLTPGEETRAEDGTVIPAISPNAKNAIVDSTGPAANQAPTYWRQGVIFLNPAIMNELRDAQRNAHNSVESLDISLSCSIWLDEKRGVLNHSVVLSHNNEEFS